MHEQYGNALQAASLEGHDKIVQLLLEEGATVNTQSVELSKVSTFSVDLGSFLKQQLHNLVVSP
jgi:ankyrin repeat protein